MFWLEIQQGYLGSIPLKYLDREQSFVCGFKEYAACVFKRALEVI